VAKFCYDRNISDNLVLNKVNDKKIKKSSLMFKWGPVFCCENKVIFICLQEKKVVDDFCKGEIQKWKKNAQV